ncbi:hypothetical protein H8356DRAFT_1316353 [Neocallimastix lanati (nom. inval.)]|nr:hypothetical protein H8356DRAFT_1316353 [Neocallimastix sp. JGI-2020a]
MFLKRNNKHFYRFIIIFLIFCISLITFIFRDFTEELTGIQYFEFLFFYIEFIFYILGILLLYISNQPKYIKLYTSFYCAIIVINILALIIEYFEDKEIFLGVLCTIFRIILIFTLLYYQVKFYVNEKNTSNVKTRDVKIDINESDIKNSNNINIKEDADKKEQKGNETDKKTFQGDNFDQFTDEDITQTEIYVNNDNKKSNKDDNNSIKGKKRRQYWKNKRNFFINYTRYIFKRNFGNKDEALKRKSSSLKESSKSLSRSVNKSIRSHKSHKSSVKAPSNEEAYCYSFFIDESIMVPGYHTDGVKTIYIDDALPIAKPKPIYSCSDDNSSSITQKIQESVKNRNKRKVIKEIYHHDYVLPSILEKDSKEIDENYGTVMETNSEIGNETEINLGLGLDLDMNLDIDFDLEIENESEIETETELDRNHYYSNKDMVDIRGDESKKEDNITFNSLINHQSYSPHLSPKDELEEESLIVSIDQNNELSQSRLSSLPLSSPLTSSYIKDHSFIQDHSLNYNNSEQENNSNLTVNINQKYTSPSLLHYSPQKPLPVASQSSLSLSLSKESLPFQQQNQYKDHYDHQLQYHPSTILSTVSSIRSSTAGDNESDSQSLVRASEFNNHKSLIRANANSITDSTILTPSTPPTTLVMSTIPSSPTTLITPTTPTIPSSPTTLITSTTPTTPTMPSSPTTFITPTTPSSFTTTISTITNTTNEKKKKRHNNHKNHHKHRHTSDKIKKSKDTGSEIDPATENKKKKSKKKGAILLDDLMIPESMNILKEDLIHYNYNKYDFPSSPSSLSSTMSSPSSPTSTSFKTESPLIKRFY